MKLYDAAAPNPRRVRIFLAEKGIDCPIQRLDLFAGESRTPEFGQINSLHETPVLEFDDGRRITESVAICRYFEAVHPDPPLFGIDAADQGLVEMWNRRMEQQIMGTVGAVGLHEFPFFADKIEQIPDYAAAQRRAMPGKWAWLDREIADGRPFIAGERFTVADITGMAALMICDFARMPVPEGLTNVEQWASRVKARPSWSA